MQNAWYVYVNRLYEKDFARIRQLVGPCPTYEIAASYVDKAKANAKWTPQGVETYGVMRLAIETLPTGIMNAELWVPASHLGPALD